MAIMFSNEIIKEYRKTRQLTLSELSDGICDLTTLRRIEKGERAPSVYLFRKLMNRLGLAPSKFYANVASKEEIIFFNLYYEIEALVMGRKYDEAHAKISELHKLELDLSKKEGKKIREQLVSVLLCSISQGKNEDAQKRKEASKYALGLTLSGFCEDKISEYMLSYEEISLLNALALAYLSAGDSPKDIDILHQVKKSMDKFYSDEYEKSRGYVLTLFNLSTALGYAQRHTESLKISNIGIEQSIKHKRLYLLPHLKFNKACALYFLDEHENVAKLAIEAVFALRNNEEFDDADERQKFAEEVMGINFPL